MNRNVDFIIVGAMKAGTSSVRFHLANHPNVCMPRRELHFFNNEKNYRKGVKWYLDKIHKNEFGDDKIYGEKTPAYSYDPKVAKRIYEVYPNVKIIWIFRNPVKRTYSNYLHSYCNGYDYLSFEQALKLEDKRVKKDIWLGYKHRSLYYLQVQEYLKYFSLEQMYFCIFEEFVKDPENEMCKIFEFLGLPRDGFELKNEIKNRTIMPRFPRMLWYSRKVFNNRSFLFKVISKLNQIGMKTKYPNIRENTSKELHAYFKEPNKKLENLINKDLSIWNIPNK